MTEQSLPAMTFTELVSVESAIRDLPLKEMEASLLRTAILTEVARMGHDTALFERAIDLAAYLHRAKHRRQRGPMQLVHYVEHPLRNTLRAIRYGVTDEHTLLAIVFHDTVEDHVWDFARLATTPGTTIADEAAAREIAFGYIAHHFGYIVSRTVRGMTNDLLPAGLTRAEKNVHYVSHVDHAMRESARVVVCKFVDFADNALSLHHSMDDGFVSRQATKYLPLEDLFNDRFEDEVVLELFGQDVVDNMRRALSASRLKEFATLA
jgi:(p)ppGpp synthase/HD superfamily hydrolase